MDDWKHLVLSCGLLAGQPEGSIPWREVCAWFEEAAGVKDGRPYLAQRLTRAHYLELLMRTAGWMMCEHPRPKYAPGPGQAVMPLDEGLFRFITDILIPVMDVFDDDVIRKDAVQNQNLIVIQQNRPSIRSMYSFLAQSWGPNDKENVVIPSTLAWVFEFAREKLEEGAAAAPPAPDGEKKEGEETKAGVDFVACLEGEDKIPFEHLGQVISCLQSAQIRVTDHHPEQPEERALLFWEFFEVLMHVCRDLGEVHQTMPLVVQTSIAVMQLVDQGEALLPDPPTLGDGDAEGDAF